MSVPENPYGELSPAERRLVEHLEVVKASPPRADRALIGQVLRTARWQRAVREPLQLVEAVAGAVIEGMTGLLGLRRGERR